MSPEDIALFQQAIDAVNSSQKQVAYQQLYSIYQHGNLEDVTLLYWLAFTTPYPHECRQAIDTIARLEPTHPKLQELRAYQARKWAPPKRQPVSPSIPTGPILTCPYCHIISPATVKSKIAVGGWIWFAAFFLLCLGCEFSLWPIAQASTMGCMGVVFLAVGIVGMLLIRKRSYSCGACGIALGDAR